MIKTVNIAVRAVDSIPDRGTIGEVFAETCQRILNRESPADAGDMILNRALTVASAMRAIERAHAQLHDAISLY